MRLKPALRLLIASVIACLLVAPTATFNAFADEVDPQVEATPALVDDTGEGVTDCDGDDSSECDQGNSGVGDPAEEGAPEDEDAGTVDAEGETPSVPVANAGASLVSTPLFVTIQFDDNSNLNGAKWRLDADEDWLSWPPYFTLEDRAMWEYSAGTITSNNNTFNIPGVITYNYILQINKVGFESLELTFAISKDQFHDALAAGAGVPLPLTLHAAALVPLPGYEPVLPTVSVRIEVETEDGSSLEGEPWALYAPMAAQQAMAPYAEGVVGANNSIEINDILPGNYRLVISPNGTQPLAFPIEVAAPEVEDSEESSGEVTPNAPQTIKLQAVSESSGSSEESAAPTPGVVDKSPDAKASADSTTGTTQVTALPSTGAGLSTGATSTIALLLGVGLLGTGAIAVRRATH